LSWVRVAPGIIQHQGDKKGARHAESGEASAVFGLETKKADPSLPRYARDGVGRSLSSARYPAKAIDKLPFEMAERQPRMLVQDE
jgi:hypothetical protein